MSPALTMSPLSRHPLSTQLLATQLSTPQLPIQLLHQSTTPTSTLPTSTWEREKLKLNQRLMPTTDTMVMLDLMLMDLERDPLMLSQRLMLMLSMVSMDMDIEPTVHIPTELTHILTPPDGEDMERDLLMLRPRLTQLSSTTLLPQFTPLSALHLSLP